MPWVSWADYGGKQVYLEYNQLKYVDLKDRLIRRGLPHSGNKAAMAIRLADDDVARPFPFLKLPAELRDVIYSLAASEYYLGSLDRYIFTPKSKLMYSFNSIDGQGTMQQPPLVCCSKQTRSEGLAIFFQQHHFFFYVSPRTPQFSRTLAWLDKIGTIGRQNIRNITLECRLMTDCISSWDLIHARLSDEATTIYTSDAWGADMRMRDIQHEFRCRNQAKVPIYSRTSINHPNATSTTQVPTLTFLPGMSWFGKENSIDSGIEAEEEYP